jgi:hypothetical protein
LPALVLLRKPLFGLAKRRKQPERYATFLLKLVDKIDFIVYNKKMKVIPFICVNIFFSIFTIFSQYNNGNGTILYENINTDEKITIRKHIQRVLVGGVIANFSENEARYSEYKDRYRKNLIVYQNPGFSEKELFELSIGEYITISEIYRCDNFKQNTFNIWLKITTDRNQSGWILYRNDDHYDNGNWTISEIIKIGNKTWTIRKVDQLMSFWGDREIDVYEKPGVKILFKLKTKDPHRDIMTLETPFITEEEITINSETDRWVKIIDREGRTGWVFGGYLDVERGGPKYRTPSNIIEANYYMLNFIN